MIPHRKTRRLLFGYIKSELSPDERASAEHHLARCASCRRELHQMRKALAAHSSTERPADRLPDTYWQDFARRVEQRIVSTPAPRWRLTLSRYSDLPFPFAPGWMLATGGAAVVAGLFLLFRQPVTPPAEPPGMSVAHTDDDRRVDRVLRRGRVLLVGLDNLRPAEGAALDLSTERHASRELIGEMRALRNTPLNPRSATVVEDLERLLIEIANTDDRTALPDVEIIRNGMRQENILFRLRMAEAGTEAFNRMRTP